MRRFLSNTIFIHVLVVLGLLAIWGLIVTGSLYLLFGIALSFSGAICGAFIRVIYAIREPA